MNFGKAWDWIKEHPVYIVGALGLFFVLYWVFSSGSSASTASGTTGPDDAVQIAGMQAQSQDLQTQAALQANSDNIGGQVQLATISAQVQNYQTEQSANVQSLGISASEQVSLAGLASQDQIASIQASVQNNQINAVEAIALAPYTTQVDELKILDTPNPYNGTTILGQALWAKGSNLNVGGITAGRAADTNGGLFDTGLGASSAGLFGAIIGAI